jgi:hypothetical protein
MLRYLLSVRGTRGRLADCIQFLRVSCALHWCASSDTVVTLAWMRTCGSRLGVFKADVLYTDGPSSTLAELIARVDVVTDAAKDIKP